MTTIGAVEDETKTIHPRVQCTINGKHATAILDTGSPISIVSRHLADTFSLNYSEKSKLTNLKGVSGTQLNVLGISRDVNIKIENNAFKIELTVIDNIAKSTLLLGLDFIKVSGLILDFANGKLTKTKLNCHKLVSKLETEDRYTIKPFSTEIIFAKISIPNNGRNLKEFPCTDLVLKQQSKFDDTIIYEVINTSSNTINLEKHQILGISYEDSSDKNISKPVTLARTPDERAKVLIKQLNVVNHPELSEAQKVIVTKLFTKYHNVFAIDECDIGNVKNYAHIIKITSEQDLIKGNRTYLVPLKFLNAAKLELDRLERLGVIYKAKTKFSVPSFFIKKANAPDKVRLINDSRHLNLLTTPEIACIPATETVLTSFNENNAQIFCSIDISDGFYSIPLDKKSQEYCSFTIPNIGSYSYAKLPLGLSGSPSSMSFVMSRALSGVRNCLVYVDDFLLFAKNVDELIDILKEVLIRLQENGLLISVRKMKFGLREISFLGFNVSCKGVRPIEDKVAAIKLLQPPTTKKGCQAVIGSLNYYTRFIKNFSEKIRPLIDCIKQPKLSSGRAPPFKLTNEAKQAFELLKLCLTKSPILRLPCPDKKFYLFTDASQKTVGAVLTQLHDGHYMPVSYFSKSMTQGQTNYCAFLRELLAIVQAIKHFKYYIEGAKFEVRSDSQTLTRPKFLTRTQIRCAIFWVLEITSRFQFTITYVKGKDNHLADNLSRIDHDSLPPTDSAKWNQWFENEFNDANNRVVNAIIPENNQLTNIGEGSEDKPFDYYNDCQGDFLENQMQDKNLAYIKTLLDTENELSPEDLPSQLSNFRRVWNFLVINRSGLVSIKWFDEATETFSLKIVVPNKCIDKILYDSHCHETGGHLNFNKTMLKARSMFWWPRMTTLVKLYCNSCEVCHKNNISSHPKPVADLKFWDSGNAPGHCIAIDVWESGRHSNSDKYVLVMVDRFSKFVTFTVMQNSRAPTIARALVDYFMSNGIPNLLLSDLGQNLQGKIMTNLLNFMKISRLRTTPFHPQGNGSAERSFRTMKNILQKFVSENPSKYKEMLPMLAYAMNTSVHPATKVSPFLLMRGFEPRHLSSLYWGITSTEFYKNRQQYALEQHIKLNKVYEFALRNTRNMEMSVAESWNHKVRYVKYHESQKVYYFQKVDNVQHRKIMSPYHEAVILKVYPADVYLIQLKKTGRKLMSSYNKLTLKPYHVQREMPSIHVRENSDDDDIIDLDMEFDKVDSENETGSDESSSDSDSNENFTSADDASPEMRPLPRRSSRINKGVPPDRYNA